MICSSLNRNLFILPVSFVGTDSNSKWSRKRVSNPSNDRVEYALTSVSDIGEHFLHLMSPQIGTCRVSVVIGRFFASGRDSFQVWE